jgi:hypothetical protein
MPQMTITPVTGGAELTAEFVTGFRQVTLAEVLNPTPLRQATSRAC